MKRTFTLMTILFLLSFSGKMTSAQNYTPLNGSDVIIHDDPTQNQQQICLKAAGNGYLYAVYTVDDGSGNIRWEIRRSTDHGNSWSLHNYTTLALNWKIVSIDLAVVGNAPADIRLYVACSMVNDVNGHAEMKVSKYDKDGSMITLLCDYIVNSPQIFRDVSVSTDYNFPSTGSNPYSIGVLYSKSSSQSGALDSIVLLTSSNGGTSLNGRSLVSVSALYARNVSLAFGRCHSGSQGQYYAAWELRESANSDLGQIWTAHSYPYFSSEFTSPRRVDNLFEDPGQYFCSHPVIKCQVNNTDNNAGNLTEVILFDMARNGNVLDYDIVGVYNKAATLADTWSITNVDATSLTSSIEPDLCFDNERNCFVATYFDVNNNKLKALSQGMNIPNPNLWELVIDQYNDTYNLVSPFPRVDADLAFNQLVFAWISSRTVSTGEAMFDGEINTVGITGHKHNQASDPVLFPNPASRTVTLSFTLLNNGKVNLGIYSIDGQKIIEVLDKDLPAGNHTISIDISSIPAGCYFYRMMTGDEIHSGKITVIKD